MDYFIGIDIGTTSVKAIAFSADGKVLFEQAIAYGMFHPNPNWSEQDPEEMVKSLFQCVENVLQHFHPVPPVLLSFSAAMHSLIAVNDGGKAVSRCLIWADNRAAAIASRFHKENRASGFYHRTGVPVHAMSPFCKLIWLREHDPSLFESAFKFIGIKEYVFFKLFGIYVVDASIASATGLMSLERVQWDQDILKEVRLHEDRLSRIVPVHEIYKSPALFPRLKNVAIVIGGSDGAMANLGTSPGRDGGLVVTIGTSSAARVIVRKPETDPAMRSFCYYIKENHYLLGGASNNGAIVLQWLRENFFDSTPGLTDFLALAGTIKAGSEGLVFLPYILGERAPVWNASAKGVLFGLTVNHTKHHVIRASMEAVINCVYAISKPIIEKRNIRLIFVTGGFAQNDLWVQILSDVFNLPVCISDTVENAAWGAVKTGMEALKLPSAGEENKSKIFSPSPELHLVYQRQFKKFERLYDLIKEEF